MGDQQSVRVDKWIWSVRIFKSRTQATAACKAGKVRIGDSAAKPSSFVKVDDRVFVRKNGFNFEFEVLKIIKKRVGAPIARTCYIDHTPEEELNKFKSWFIGKAQSEYREKGAGRPTKKERRVIDEFKTDFFYETDWDDED